MNDRGKAPTNRGAVAANRSGLPQDFLRGVIAEMRRVTWPTREEWMSATLLTIILVAGIGLFTFGVDWIVGKLFLLVHP